MTPGKGLISALVASVLLPVSASAFPIAIAGTEGLAILVGGTDPVIAKYEGNSAAYSNDLILELVLGGTSGLDGNPLNDMFVFNNHSSVVGSTVNLGSFAIGTEFIFRLFVRTTGDHFFSGAASRNPDGLPHARVEANWMPNTTLVSFEDLLSTPEGVNGFNDLSFSFTNTTTPTATPEPLSLALLGTGLGAVVLSRRRRC